ncbi:class I SAM-dependent methyltransferase [Candidatus Pacearchaeota archaeon]|nr:class I SAM-dependent methyltransferase [Candidatus Pacearchaeota archaeon]
MTNKELKNIDFWQKVLQELPESYKLWFKDEKKFLYKNITKNSKVLEVGCGDGRSIKDIIDITQNITAIDNDPKAVIDASNNFKRYKTINISLANAKDLPFKDNTFDHVLCLTTFANFGDDKYKILEEMKRVVRKKGTIIISVFSEDALDERMKVYKSQEVPIKEIAKNGKIIFDESVGANVSEQFSKKELIKIFSKVKFTVEEIEKSGIGYMCKLSKDE